MTAIAPGAFSGLSALQTLDLGPNLLSSVDSSLFAGAPNLAVLYNRAFITVDYAQPCSDLDTNSIKAIQSSSFAGMTRLACLYVGPETFNCA